MIKAVFFDLDNTLVDRSKSIERFAQRFIEHYQDGLAECDLRSLAAKIKTRDNGGYLPQNSGFSSIGQAMSCLLVTELDWHYSVEQEELEHFWRSTFAQCSVAMSGARSLLTRLVQDGFYLGVISNGSEKSRRLTLEFSGLANFFQVLVSSQAVDIKKPSPEIFMQTASCCGFTPAECCYIGDHPVNDMSGATAAGMKAIWLEGFHSPQGIPAEIPRVSGLSEIHQIISDFR